MEKIFEGKNIQVMHHLEEQYLEVKWVGAVSSDEFRKAGKMVMQHAIKSDVRKWLLNQHKMMLLPQDFEWIIQELYPKAKNYLAAKSWVAVVLNTKEDAYTEFSLKHVLEELFPPTRQKAYYFPNEETARQWLNETDDLEIMEEEKNNEI